jgi:hypothetical protein
MLVFFSNRVGVLGSIAISVLITLRSCITSSRLKIGVGGLPRSPLAMPLALSVAGRFFQAFYETGIDPGESIAGPDRMPMRRWCRTGFNRVQRTRGRPR